MSASEETDYFDSVERGALGLAESVTQLSDGHVSDASYAGAAAVLTGEQISSVAWLTIVMNAFNRVAVTSRYEVAGSRQG